MSFQPTIEQSSNSYFPYSDAENDDGTNVCMEIGQIQFEPSFSFIFNDPDTFNNNDPGTFNNDDPDTFNNNDPDTFNNNDPDTLKNNDSDTFNNNDPDTLKNNDPDTFNNDEPDISIDKNDAGSIDDGSNILNLSNNQNQSDQIQQQQPQTCKTSSNYSSSFQNQPQQLLFPCIQTNFNIGSSQLLPAQPKQVPTQLHQAHSTNYSNFLIMAQQYLPQIFKQNSRSSKRSPFYKGLMRIYSDDENAEINKYILNAIFKIINQIVDDEQFEKKYFNRGAQRSIYKCIDNYQNVAPLIFHFFTIFKEVGVINYEEDRAAYKRFRKAKSIYLINSYFQTKPKFAQEEQNPADENSNFNDDQNHENEDSMKNNKNVQKISRVLEKSINDAKEPMSDSEKCHLIDDLNQKLQIAVEDLEAKEKAIANQKQTIDTLKEECQEKEEIINDLNQNIESIVL